MTQSSDDSDFTDQAADFVETCKTEIMTKHQLNKARKKTMLALDTNGGFKMLMQKNPVIIFPELDLHAWDRLPRFTFLEADIKS